MAHYGNTTEANTNPGSFRILFQLTFAMGLSAVIMFSASGKIQDKDSLIPFVRYCLNENADASLPVKKLRKLVEKVIGTPALPEITEDAVFTETTPKAQSSSAMSEEEVGNFD